MYFLQKFIFQKIKEKILSNSRVMATPIKERLIASSGIACFSGLVSLSAQRVYLHLHRQFYLFFVDLGFIQAYILYRLLKKKCLIRSYTLSAFTHPDIWKTSLATHTQLNDSYCQISVFRCSDFTFIPSQKYHLVLH